VESCSDEACYTHIDYEPIPSKESVIDIINRLREILFPGYFSRGKVERFPCLIFFPNKSAIVSDMTVCGMINPAPNVMSRDIGCPFSF
jgi:hypothetical protein